MGTIGGTQSGMTGAGHCRNTGLHLHGGHGVHGTGGGQHGWQHGHGGGHEYLQGPVPHGKIAGQVGQKQHEHILKILFSHFKIFPFSDFLF